MEKHTHSDNCPMCKIFGKNAATKKLTMDDYDDFKKEIIKNLTNLFDSKMKIPQPGYEIHIVYEPDHSHGYHESWSIVNNDGNISYFVDDPENRKENMPKKSLDVLKKDFVAILKERWIKDVAEYYLENDFSMNEAIKEAMKDYKVNKVKTVKTDPSKTKN